MTRDGLPVHPGLDGLGATGPHPSLAEQLALFGQFVGGWNLHLTEYLTGGATREADGEWHFGWALEGRAIQDVWIVPDRKRRARPGTELIEYGTALRFYDAAQRDWRVTWIGPIRNSVRQLRGRGEGDNIVLRTTNDSGQQMRWTFSDICADSFRWTSTLSTDGGHDWQTLQLMEVRRRIDPADPTIRGNSR